MKDLMNNYTNYIDELRRLSNIKVIDFCDGVCNPRTYRKYLSGDITMSQDKLIGFCDKLNITLNEFYQSYARSDQEELQAVYSLLAKIRLKEYKKARQLMQDLDKRHFTNRRAKQLYDYCIILYNFKNNNMHDAYAHDTFSNLINYPDMLTKNMFDIVDLLTLTQLSITESKIDKHQALNMLIELLTDRSKLYISASDRYYLPTMYAYVANVLGRMKYIEQSLAMSELGIQYSLHIKDLRELEHLYYYHALSLHKTNHPEEALEYARKAIMSALIKNKTDYINRLITIMEKDFDVSRDTLLQLSDLDKLKSK